MPGKMNKPKVGEKFYTNQGCQCVVLEYNNAFDVLIQFLDEVGHIRSVRTGDLRRGEVANPFFRSVYGVGYFGVESNSPHGYKTNTREHMFWKGIMERSYSESNLSRSPTYAGCIVDERWHNFQDFAEWCQYQVGFKQSGWQLDKDLLSESKPGKVYSPDICVFVPQEVNTLFIVPSTKQDELPTGVSYSKQRGKYVASCGQGGTTKGLGRYDTPELAHEAYLKYKKIRVSEVIEKYSGRVDDRVIDKLKEFTV